MPPKLSSPEAPFENRFFSVIIKDGKAVMTDTTQIAAINGSEAEKLALSALESGVQSGWSGDYRYAVQALDDKGTLVVFLDCGRNLASFRSYMRTSALLYVCALAAVFALLALLSGRVVKPISESYEKQRRFVADAGHDIKTPITIIDADAEVLQMELGDNEWVSDIKAQTGRLAVLIATLMELSRMEQPINRRQMIEFPLSDIAAETAQSFQAKAKLQNKTLIINAEPMLSFYGDENALRQLVSILCDNAVKYSPKDSEIRLTLEKSREARNSWSKMPARR